jgi:large subunit ribosomal protein L31
MKVGIHPTYTHQAKVVCASCGNTFVTGSTLELLQIELCSNCHPFYTGKQNLIDTAGRVDRFKKLVEKSSGTGKTVRGKRAKLEAKKARRAPKASKEEPGEE